MKTVDRELFARQAEQYGFDKKEYLAALERVPRWSREKVDQAMDFYARFAALVSQLSYSNLKLAQLLHRQKLIEAEVEKSEAKYRAYIENSPVAVFVVDSERPLPGCKPRRL